MIPQPTYGMRQAGNGRRILPREDEPQEQAPLPEPQPAPQPVAPQPAPQPEPQLQVVPKNITQFPPRGLLGNMPMFAKWLLWTVAVLTLTAILAYILSSVDEWEEESRGRSRGKRRTNSRSRRSFLDDLDDGEEGEDDDDDDDDRAARARSKGGRTAKRTPSSASQPAIHVHVPHPGTPPAGNAGSSQGGNTE